MINAVLTKIIDDHCPMLERRESIVLTSRPCRDSQMPLGCSKLGGDPDFPTDQLHDALAFDEKEFVENYLFAGSFKDAGESKPSVYFVGQISFDEIALFDSLKILPEDGLLSIFLLETTVLLDATGTTGSPVTPGTQIGAKFFQPKFLYLNKQSGLQRLVLRSLAHTSHPSRLAAHAWITVPAFTADTTENIMHQYAAMTSLLNREFLNYFYPAKSDFEFDTPWHQMLGFSRDLGRSQRLPSGKENWHLLLQIDSDSIVSLSWGYQGQLYFWIKEADLQAQDFSKIELQFGQSNFAQKIRNTSQLEKI